MENVDYRWRILLLEFEEILISYCGVSTCLRVTVFMVVSGYWFGFDSRPSRYEWSVWLLDFEETLVIFRESAHVEVCQCVCMQASSDVDSIVDSLATDETSCCLRLAALAVVDPTVATHAVDDASYFCTWRKVSAASSEWSLAQWACTCKDREGGSAKATSSQMPLWLHSVLYYIDYGTPAKYMEFQFVPLQPILKASFYGAHHKLLARQICLDCVLSIEVEHVKEMC